MNAASSSLHKTFLHQLDARTKLAAMMAILILVLVFSHPLYMAAILALVLVAWIFSRLPFTIIASIFKYFGFVAVLIFALQAFFYPGTIHLFRLSGPAPVIGFSGYITLEGVLFGLAMVLRLLIIMVVAPLLVMTTSLPELMLGLIKIKVKYRFAFLLTTTMSLLPSIQTRADLIQQAQLCRGVENLEKKNFFARLRALSAMLIPLILGAFRDSQTLDVAISSRAFGAPVKRTFLLESRLRPVDYAVLVLSLLVTVGGIILRIYHFGIV